MSGDTITFVNGNVWGGRKSYPMINALNILQPDIMNMQEAYSAKYNMGEPFLTLEMMTRGKLVSSQPRDNFVSNLLKGTALGNAPFMKKVMKHDVQGDRADTFFDDFVAGPAFPEWEMKLFGQKLDFRNSTAVKGDYKIKETKVVPIGQDRPNRAGGDYYNLMHTVVTLPNGTDINVLCYHGEVVRGIQTREGHPVTDNAGREIAGYRNTIDGPTILSADFNVYPHSDSIKAITDNCDLVSLNSNVEFRMIEDDRLKGGRVAHGRSDDAWMFGNEIVTDIMHSSHFKLVGDGYIIPPDPKQCQELLVENIDNLIFTTKDIDNITGAQFKEMMELVKENSHVNSPYLMTVPSDHKFHMAKLQLK